MTCSSAFPDARVNIDCKADGAVEPLVDLLPSTTALDRVCVGAFSRPPPATISGPVRRRLCSALGPRRSRWLAGLRVSRAPAAQVPVQQGPLPVVTQALVERAHRLGLPVHVWTIDDPAEMGRLLDLGVDGLMTDRRSVLKDVLVARGQWTTS